MTSYINLAASRDLFNTYAWSQSRIIRDEEHLYVYEWTTLQDRVCARGIDASGSLAMFELDLKTGLVIMTEDPNLIQDLALLANVSVVKIEQWDGFSLETVSLTLLDKFNGEREQSMDHVFFVQTANFADSKRLHRQLVQCIPLNKRMATFGDWTIELLVNLYQYKLWQRTGNLFNVHLNRVLQVNDQMTTHIPVVSFDIETVSTKDTRVPMGDQMTDVLFSLSICTSDGVNIDAFNTPQRYHSVMPQGTKLFSSEVELLEYLINFFVSYPTVFFCTGYNVVWYDLSFIIKRAIYYGLDVQPHLHNSNGMPCIGAKMIVVDLMDVIGKFFKEMVKTNMKLSSILSTFLEDTTKVDLDAVKLRYVYRDMVHEPTIQTDWPQYDISLEKAVRYNHVDALGVLLVWKKYDLANFIRHGAQYMNINHARFAVSKVTEYLSTNFLLECFKRGKLFTVFKPKRISAHNGTVIRYDFNELGAISSEQGQDCDSVSYSFGGGFNYRSAVSFHRDVQMMDMVCYYPYIIEGFKLSHETCMILPKDGVQRYSEQLFTPQFNLCAFDSHKMPDADGLVIISKLYVKGLMDNVVRVHRLEQLDSYKDSDRFVIISNEEGILPQVIAQQNKSRGDLKVVTKKLKKLSKLKKKWSSELVDESNLMTMEQLTVKNESMFEPSVKFIKEGQLKCLNKQLVDWYFKTVSAEHDRLFGLFRNLKIVNNSLYGFLYSDYGCVQGKQVASIVTLLGRRFIIESAKISEQHGYECVFMDTDSIFVRPLNKDASAPSVIRDTLLEQNSKLELNFKTYPDLLVLAKKVYFATSPKGLICRGITRNGPALWEHYMFKLYQDVVTSDTLVYGSHIDSFLRMVYNETYDKLETDRTILLCAQSCKQLQEYATNTPMKRLLERYQAEQQVNENPNKMVYWYAHEGAVNNAHWRFEHELETVDLAEINLYKFYQRIFKQLYHLFNAKIITTCQHDGFDFYLNLKAFDGLAMRAYLEVRQQRTGQLLSLVASDLQCEDTFELEEAIE